MSLSAAVFKNSLKMKTLSVYKNNWKADTAEMWILKIKAYFQFYKTLMNWLLSDEAKITVMISYLKDTVKVWWLWKEEQLQAEEDLLDIKSQNMNNFFLAFLLIFENINEMKHQCCCYEALKQTKLIQQYKVKFTKIVQLLQSISVKYKQKQQFTQSLKQKIWSEL